MKSLDSIHKSLEDRFDRKNQTINESHIRDYDLQKQDKQTSTFFRIEFSSSIPEETKSFLKNNTPTILDFPSKFGLNILHINHLIRFIDQETYESEMGSHLPKYITLPASRFEKINSGHGSKITIIIPKIIDNAKIVVNITRTIFSNIFGRIFFNEQILPLEFYQHSSYGKSELTTTIPEILDLIDEFYFSSKILQSNCESFAKLYQLNFSKNNNNIKKQLIKEWRKKWKDQTLSSEEKHTLESIFNEFIHEFKVNPEYFYKSFSKRIKQLNSDLHFILPHEMKTYINFERNRFIHYINVVKNKLEEINSLSGFIEEIDSLLKNPPKVEDLKMLGLVIRSRMKEMRKEKKAQHFYIPQIINNSDWNNIKERFPILLIKMLPPGTPLRQWSKEIKKLERNYTKSIYTKIYSSLHYFSKGILVQHDFNKNKFSESMEGQNIKKLLPYLKYQKESIKILQSNLGLLIDTSEKLSLEICKDNSKHLVPLEDFGKAWSYFISSILTMLYYKEFSEFESTTQGFRSVNFEKSILKFVEKQCSNGINHFHIVKLLWLVYKKENTDPLKFLIHCIKNPQNILRYILHQLMIPEIGEDDLNIRLEKIPNYSDTLISVYKKRLKRDK